MEVWTALGCTIGIITAWIALSWRLRNEAEHYNVTTFTDYLAKKHSREAKALRVTTSLVIVFFFFLYVGAQFLGGGKTLFTMFHLDTRTGMLITALIIIPYTIIGGFRSVVYTDVVQALLMITALVIGPIIGVFYIAGHPEVFAHSIPEALHKAGSGYLSLTHAASGFSIGVIITGGLSWFFGYLGGQPQLSMRFMAIKNSRQARIARNIGILWTIVAYVGALCLGWIGLAIFGPQGLDDQEFVMPMVLMRILPPALAALLITGAIAAMISTADSLLILSSTELSQNILPRATGDRAEKKNLNRSRITTAAVAVVALVVAYLSPEKLIFTVVGYVWAGIGSTFSVVILLSLFWKRFHGRAALVTILTGITFTIVWISTGLDEKVITARVMTFLVAGIVAVATTLVVPRKTV
jgi:sodium/proline symporter